MHSLIQNIVVEAAGCGGQHPQGPQHKSGLLARNCLLQLFHMLLDVCGGPQKKNMLLLTLCILPPL